MNRSHNNATISFWNTINGEIMYVFDDPKSFSIYGFTILHNNQGLVVQKPKEVLIFRKIL